ncbi:MAG: DNA methyltransferase [Candidatus Doudnabacteria bacterium]|nr:DNA methyltransferase [bacterium]MDZ4244093.1 DNA methyltransferase [Candidatus Doudnabacteria bacterium]
MKPKYAFNLGRVFTLSLAELFSVFENMGLAFRLVDLYREILIIETEEELDLQKLQKRVGGTIRIMRVLDSLGRKKMYGPSAVFKDYFDAKLLKEKFLPLRTGKVQVGVSIFPMARQLPLYGESKRIGLDIKRILAAAGTPCRVVLPQSDSLSLPSVIVTNERLLEKGAEIDFLVSEERIYLAKTITVQDFEDYGRRDYQRPSRDQHVGMLPPKVAQMMINFALYPEEDMHNPKCSLLDPFVGSGTIIQEAMIMGLRGIGSDLSEKAIENAEKNLLWIKNRYKLPPGRFELAASDVKDLSANLPQSNYEAIVTEGTLGPVYAAVPSENEIKQNFKNLEQTYMTAFAEFKKILKPGKRVVIAFPAYRLPTAQAGTRAGYRFFDIVDKIIKSGYDIVDPVPAVLLERFDFLQVTKRKSIIYDRKDQFVSREIFIFRIQ